MSIKGQKYTAKMYPVRCIECGTIHESIRKNTKYCVECREERRRTNAHLSQQRIKKLRKERKEQPCIKCGIMHKCHGRYCSKKCRDEEGVNPYFLTRYSDLPLPTEINEYKSKRKQNV